MAARLVHRGRHKPAQDRAKEGVSVGHGMVQADEMTAHFAFGLIGGLAKFMAVHFSAIASSMPR